MLQLVEPYITYGEVNLKAIRELVYKRGYLKIDGSRIPITDNGLIEKQLGKYGIICKFSSVSFAFAINPMLIPFQVSRTLFTRSPPVDPTSRRPLPVSGHSSSRTPLADGEQRSSSATSRVVTPETENSTCPSLFTKWSKPISRRIRLDIWGGIRLGLT